MPIPYIDFDSSVRHQQSSRQRNATADSVSSIRVGNVTTRMIMLLLVALMHWNTIAHCEAEATDSKTTSIPPTDVSLSRYYQQQQQQYPRRIRRANPPLVIVMTEDESKPNGTSNHISEKQSGGGSNDRTISSFRNHGEHQQRNEQPHDIRQQSWTVTAASPLVEEQEFWTRILWDSSVSFSMATTFPAPASSPSRITDPPDPSLVFTLMPTITEGSTPPSSDNNIDDPIPDRNDGFSTNTTTTQPSSAPTKIRMNHTSAPLGMPNIPTGTTIVGTATNAPTAVLDPCLDGGSIDGVEELSMEEYLWQLLTTVSHPEDLRNATSPQGMAYQWTLRQQQQLLLLHQLETVESSSEHSAWREEWCRFPIRVLQPYALVVFYFATGGDGWHNSTHWLSTNTSGRMSRSECHWYGVICDGETVIELDLEKNNISGTLPTELALLTSIEALNLFQNRIRGTMPYLPWTTLRRFDIERNQFRGPLVPGDWRVFPHLQYYRVSHNAFTGTIPVEGLAQSTQLLQFWLASNQLDGTIPSEIGTLQQLDSIILYRNKFTGPIPSELGSLHNLTYFHVHDNALTGSIPDSFWSNTNIIDLRMERNLLSGTISSSIGDLTSLRALRIGENLFSGSLPPQFYRLSNLVVLSVNATDLTGLIRDSFEPFHVLQYADFSNCLLTGTLPSSIFNIPSIQLLYFQGNDLTGVIPSNYGNAPLLRDLYIYDNKIRGMIPPIQPSQMNVLTEFLLHGNDISGVMPASICALRGREEDDQLFRLTADCLGNPPRVLCSCCTSCFS